MPRTTTELTDYPGVTDLTESERYDLLTAEPRRLALAVLADRSPPVELADLAAEIAARTDGRDATDEETVERIGAALHHKHLPRMDELNVVDYDVDSCRITG